MLFVTGINHRTAPVALRERAAFSPAETPDALDELRQRTGVSEACVLSTCNRTELVVRLEDAEDGAACLDWLADRAGIARSERGCLYSLRGMDAISHVLRVACGLDSMVLGEPQILGQTKDAYRLAHEAGSTGPMLNRLYQQAFATAKLIRTSTGVGSSPVSVAFTAIQLAKRIFAGFEDHTALLVGAGDTIELVARHLHAHGIGRMIIANRSIERAHRVAREFSAEGIGLDELAAHLQGADMVISSTAAPQPLIDQAMVRDALRRRRRALFMVDLAVPRDIDERVAELEDVYLYTVDDLQQVIEQGMEARRQAADEADLLITVEAARVNRELRALDTAAMIRDLRGRGEGFGEELLARADRRLDAGDDPREVMAQLTRDLTRKLMHAPTDALRKAGAAGDLELIGAARQLLDLDDPDEEDV